MRMIWVAALCCFSGASLAEDVVFADGVEDCSMIDADGDRLRGCEEFFGNVSDPLDADSDDDGLSDGDEVLGTIAGLNLPAMGAKPRRKTIFLEIDWVEDSFECGDGLHSHRPADGTIAAVQKVFRDADTPNPDGSTGVDLIVDHGQGGLFAGGNLVSFPDGVVDWMGSAYYASKSANFAPIRQNVFHYQVWVHKYKDVTTTSSGWAELGGDDGIVSLWCRRSESNQQHAMAHELVHNFLIDHGGNTPCNVKPNYNSIMNYRYQFHGVDRDCDSTPNGPAEVDFSYGSRIELDEHALDEKAGMCPDGPPIDWNGDGTLQSGLAFDLNPGFCGDVLSSLLDFNDWASMNLKVVATSGGGATPPGFPSQSCAEPPAE